MIPKGILPENLMDGAYIAGGYAACPALATDMDVWVYVQPEAESLPDARARILTHLENEQWQYEVEEANLRSEGADRSGYPLHSAKVAVIRRVHALPVHIIVTSAAPADLLEAFDVSTHQVALIPGNVIKGSGWTPVTVPPVALLNTPNTPERMRKIAARFGHPAPHSILETR